MANPKKTRAVVPVKASVSSPAPVKVAPQITFEQFTESSMGAVLRAVKAQKLPHQPIIVGLIWHPGLGTGTGGGYGGQTTTCGFDGTVKPFFTSCFRQHMLFMFDLWDAGTVQANWQAIHDAVANGSMPAAGCPDSFDQAAFLAAFQCWKDQGFPA